MTLLFAQLSEARRKVRELQTSEADKEVAIHRLEAKLALASIEARQSARREQERIEVRSVDGGACRPPASDGRLDQGL